MTPTLKNVQVRASVRRAHIKDLQAITHIERACFHGNAWTPQDLRKQFDHKFAVMTVFDGEKVTSTSTSTSTSDSSNAVGFLLSWQTGNEVQLMRLCVEPEWQGKGIGSLLVNELLHNASTCLSEDEPKEVITLEVRESNAKARAFYEKFGFNQIALRKKYYSDGENAILMEKTLGLG